MSDWQRVSALETPRIGAAADSVSGALGTISSVLDIIAKALDMISKVLIDPNDPLRQILSAAVDAIEAMILAILQNNVHVAVHINAHLNPAWRYDWGSASSSPNLSDWIHKSELPWSGTGVTGWLREIAISAYNPLDSMRPWTDATAAVSGLIFITGVRSGSELSDLKPLIELFGSNWDNLLKIPDAATRLRRVKPRQRALARLGQAIVHEEMQALTEGVEDLAGLADVNKFIPWPGGLPQWMSVPLSRAIPPIANAFDRLQELISTLRPLPTLSSGVSAMAAALRDKINLLREILDALDALIETIESLIALFTQGYMMLPTVESGGFNTWIQTAMGANQATEAGVPVGPDFGDDGLVAGFVLCAVNADAKAALTTFMETILGITNVGASVAEEDIFSSEFS